MFRTVPLSIINQHLVGYIIRIYHDTRTPDPAHKLSANLYDIHQGGTSSALILLASCQQTCMTYTIAVCTVKNS